ncbi:MerR family transcriptional regulator [Amnibacterium flavum]|uniref:MerR family transcriptional regulator n=1 Tax=Amnibacterium flavum TaxID=2173173 RepID=A0A2V1HWU4_9MICO|nr:MerR family transcriptional regulator [Amnibacterium flavum]PVZ94704.1 MerR family transcriptional regulator [Amnibacterium flavum]
MSALPARDLRAPTAAVTLLNIGQVLAKLKPEFPDLTSSKVRFLEDERLLSPARTESGYRKFSTHDLERLRLILTLQRDQYLPLKVIRGYLADLDAGRSPSWPGRGSADGSMLVEEHRYSREELIREAGATPGLLDDAISASLVPPAEVHSDETLGVLKALVELGTVGIEPRHLRSLRTAADREAGLLESAVQPVLRRREPGSRARGVEQALDLATHLEVVRTSLLRAAIGKISG